MYILPESSLHQSRKERLEQKFSCSNYHSLFIAFVNFGVEKCTETPKRLSRHDLGVIAFSKQILCIYPLVFQQVARP